MSSGPGSSSFNTAGSHLDRVAERFDALYSELTVLQRRLISAQRGELDERAEAELIEEASVITASVTAAARALAVGRPSHAEMEAEAHAARVLHHPIDDYLLLAAMSAQGRAEAYQLLSAALRMSASRAGTDGMPEGLARRELAEFLAAPRGMADRSGRLLLRHWGRDHDLRVGDVPIDQIDELCDRIEDAGAKLPPEVRGTRVRQAAAPPDGRGAGDRVLSSWVDACGLPADGVRPLAAAAAAREGWPADAAPVAFLIADFTNQTLFPAILGQEWEKLLMIADEQERLRAMRAQSLAWMRTDDEERQAWGVALRIAAELLQAEVRLRGLEGDYSRRAGGQTAMALARTIARRGGELLGWFEEDWARGRLATLPRQPS